MAPAGPPGCSAEVVRVTANGDVWVDDVFQFSPLHCGDITTFSFRSCGSGGLGKLSEDWPVAREGQTEVYLTRKPNTCNHGTIEISHYYILHV